jgi:hypothetical protein
MSDARTEIESHGSEGRRRDERNGGRFRAVSGGISRVAQRGMHGEVDCLRWKPQLGHAGVLGSERLELRPGRAGANPRGCGDRLGDL